MKHAGPAALAELADLLQGLRQLPCLRERTPGSFYRRGTAFLHFHQDPAGLFADVKLDGRSFQRWPVSTAPQRQAVLAAVRAVAGL